MFALPPDLSDGAGLQLTGVSCPDCAGVLQAEIQGHKGHLHFVCRVGHAYALTALLTAKEQVLEDRLWTTVLALEELAQLLRDLEAHAVRFCWAGVEQPCRSRAGAAGTYARVVREIIDHDRPVELGIEVPGSEPSDHPRAAS